MDTAGIRDTDDKIEKIGINKSIEKAKEADLVIAIIDSSRKLEEEDMRILEIIKDKKAIVLLNKIDKKEAVDREKLLKIAEDKPILEISALNKTGINKIYEQISNMYGLNEIRLDDSLTVTNERHKQAIRNMKEYIYKSKDAIESKMPIDIVTINITNILEEIGKITGESVSDDIIKEIFKKFCLGK